MKCLFYEAFESRTRIDVIFGSCYGKERLDHPQKLASLEHLQKEL